MAGETDGAGDSQRPSNDESQDLPSHIRRELSEVYLLMDHVAGRTNTSLVAALSGTLGEVDGAKVLLSLCNIRWPSKERDKAEDLALTLAAKDKLAHSAFPATALSIAFTYLSTAKMRDQPKLICRIWRRMRLFWQNYCKQAPENSLYKPPTSGVAHYAELAFPNLIGRQELLNDALRSGIPRVIALFFITAFVLTDLAIGQHILSDYRWLVDHPAVMTPDTNDRTLDLLSSDVDYEKLDGALPPTCISSAQAKCSSSRQEKCGSSAPKLPAGYFPVCPGSQMARQLAYLRVSHFINCWNDGYLIRLILWLRPTILPTAAITFQMEGESIERLRLGVSTLNYAILPLLLGALAAHASLLRSIGRKVKTNELVPRDIKLISVQIVLGCIASVVTALLFAPALSNDFPANSGQGGSAAMSASVDAITSIGLPALYAFLAGFSSERIFRFIEQFTDRFVSSIPQGA